MKTKIEDNWKVIRSKIAHSTYFILNCTAYLSLLNTGTIFFLFLSDLAVNYDLNLPIKMIYFPLLILIFTFLITLGYFLDRIGLFREQVAVATRRNPYLMGLVKEIAELKELVKEQTQVIKKNEGAVTQNEI